MSNKKMLFVSVLLVALAAAAAGLLTINPSSMIENAIAQMYEDEYEYYDNSYFKNEDRNGYDNGYGYINGYLEKDKKQEIFPTNKVSELGDRWWQWAYDIDTTTVNPFTDLGQDGCDIGLQDNGRLLLLVVAPREPDTGDFPVHECEVKEETSVLFPILNVACNNLAVDTPFFGTNEQDQRNCANKIIRDATLFDALHVNIDGIEVQNLQQYRIDSPAGGFEFTAVQNNVFDTPVGAGKGVSDSLWILIEYLNPGKHTISFSGAINLDNIPPLMGLYEAGATYNLDVIPRYY
jgi:hypothetical protein